MGAKFYSMEDAHQKIDRSVCWVDGVPYYIRHRGEGDLVSFHDMETQKPLGMIEYTSERFNYKDYTLGYLNLKSQAMWCYRSPLRRREQALVGLQINREARDFFISKPMKDCLMNVYPSYQQAWKIVSEGGRSSMAFSKHAALKRTFGRVVLLYRDMNVGSTPVHAITSEPPRFTAVSSEYATIIAKYMHERGVLIT